MCARCCCCCCGPYTYTILQCRRGQRSIQLHCIACSLLAHTRTPSTYRHRQRNAHGLHESWMLMLSTRTMRCTFGCTRWRDSVHIETQNGCIQNIAEVYITLSPVLALSSILGLSRPLQKALAHCASHYSKTHHMMAIIITVITLSRKMWKWLYRSGNALFWIRNDDGGHIPTGGQKNMTETCNTKCATKCM